MTSAKPGKPDDTATRYEPLDVPRFVPLWLGSIIAGFVLLVLIAIWIGFPLADRQEPRGPMHQLPPSPRVETAPMAALQRYRLAKREELAGKGATMPIEAAMRATAQQGWGAPR